MSTRSRPLDSSTLFSPLLPKSHTILLFAAAPTISISPLPAPSSNASDPPPAPRRTNTQSDHTTTLTISPASSPSSSLPVQPSGNCDREVEITKTLMIGLSSNNSSFVFSPKIPRQPLPLLQEPEQIHCFHQFNSSQDTTKDFEDIEDPFRLTRIRSLFIMM